MSRFAVFFVLAAVLMAGASAAPTRKLLNDAKNVAVTAPGTAVRVAPGATAVVAPGTKVLATSDVVAVKAPANTKVAVDKRAGVTAVSAPGTSVLKTPQATAVTAPGTTVLSTPQGTAVNAPFTQVLTGAAAAGTGCKTVVRVPIVGLNFCADGGARRLFF